MNFFDFKNTIGRSPFLTREIFYPPEGEHFIAPQGVPIWSLSVLYLHRELFFGFQITPCNRPFLTRDFFYPPEGEHFIAPQGVPIWDLSVLYLHRESFFWFRFSLGTRPFLTPEIFYPLEVVPNAAVPLWGSIWVSFSFISTPRNTFLTFDLHQVSVHFWPAEFFIPRRWS